MDEAQKKAALIKQTTDDEIRKIEQEAVQKAEEKKTILEGKVETQVAALIEKSKTLAVMEGRSQLLREKREIIDQVYTELEKELNHLAGHDYVKLLAEMLKHTSGSVEKGHLVIPAGRRSLTDEALEKSKVDYQVKDESHDLKGGFVLTSGKTEVNMSFSYLIQNVVRPSTELEVAKILFS